MSVTESQEGTCEARPMALQSPDFASDLAMPPPQLPGGAAPGAGPYPTATSTSSPSTRVS
jgi:hypothetical protein